MKKALKLSAVLLMLLSVCLFALTGCGSEDEKLPPKTTKDPVTSAVESVVSETEATETEETETEEITTTAHEHDPVTMKDAAATCTEPGYTGGKECSICGEILEDPTEKEPAKGHKEEKVSGVAPTCSYTGTSDGAKCSVCGETLTKQKVLPKTEHTPKDVPGTAPTCIYTGTTDGSKCSVCGKVLKKQETLPKLEHTLQDVPGWVATCSYDGATDGSSCSVCGGVIVAQETIPALPHTPATVSGWAATCSAEGATDGTVCAVCNAVISGQQSIPKTNHNYAPATYSSPMKCTVCGATSGSALSIGVTSVDVNGPYDYSFETEFSIMLKDSNGDTVSCPATVVAKVVNSKGETVLNKTYQLTEDKYDYFDRAELKYLPSDCTPGLSNKGTLYITVTLSDGTSFKDKDMGEVKYLPLKPPVITFPALPQTLNAYTYNNKLETSVSVTEVKYMDGDLYWTGEKLYDMEGNGFSRACEIGWKLYDANGYIVDSGIDTSTAVKVGEKFKDCQIYCWYDFEPGGVYTLEILDTK